MAEEELKFRATFTDAGATRGMKKLGDAADDSAGDVKGLDRQLDKLDEQLDLTKLHLATLVHEFKETGDIELLKGIRKDRSLIRQLELMKEKVDDVAGAAGQAGAAVGDELGEGIVHSLRSTLSSLPAELKGAAIAGAVGLGVAMGPLLGAAAASAVLGGVGVGGIIGGIALAAKDTRVASAAQELGTRFSTALAGEAQVFVQPLVNALDILQDPADNLAETLGDGFSRLAPLSAGIARNLDKAVDAISPGLEDAFDAAVPVVTALSNELPEIAEAAGDFLSIISEDSDGAILALAAISEFLQQQLYLWGGVLRGAEETFEFFVRYGNKITEVGDKWMGWMPIAGQVGDFVNHMTDELLTDLEKAKSANETYVGSIEDVNSGLYGTVQAMTEARGAMVKYQESIEAQFDPVANLVQRLRDIKQRQKEYNEAVEEHGRNSEEARQANLDLATAVLAANTAAANAAGTFDGKLSPALRHTLQQGGLTEAQIRDIERQFRAATAAGAGFAKTYRAKAVLDAREFYGSLAAANNALSGSGYVSGRASGGPVAAGRTYLVGEEGPELITMPQDGYVHHAQATQQLMSGASGGSSAPMGGAPSGQLRVEVLVRPAPGASRELMDNIVSGLQFEVRTVGAGSVNTLLEG